MDALLFFGVSLFACSSRSFTYPFLTSCASGASASNFHFFFALQFEGSSSRRNGVGWLLMIDLIDLIVLID